MHYRPLILFVFVFFFCSLLLVSCKKTNQQTVVSGTMRITSTPSDAFITILNKEIGKTPRITNPVPPGMYIVKIWKDKYKTIWIPVKVENGKETLVKAELEPLRSTVIIDSVPTGAHISIDGKEYGDTPLVLSDLPLGTYTALFHLPGYAQKKVTWEIPNERPLLIKEALTNNIGTLSLTSIPEVASVMIDGKSYGNTPLKETLEQGQYKLQLMKEGYKNYETLISIQRENTTEMKIALETLPGSLALESQPTGATILIDGIEHGVTPYICKTMEVGDYEITLRKNGYDDLVETVSIQPGMQIQKEFIMQSNTGNIVLSVNPVGMNVYLDGKFITKTIAENDKNDDISKPITISDLPHGKHTITVSNKNADPQKREIVVTVQKGKTTLVPKIEFWLPNTELILKNGSIYKGRISGRYTEDSEKLLFRHSIGINSEYKRSEIRAVTSLKLAE